jgi:hypothetical protein
MSNRSRVTLSGLAACAAFAAVTGDAQAALVSEEYFSPGPRERPSAIVGGDSFGYANLTWSSWGTSTAEATGSWEGLDYSTGEERTVSYPVRITLSRPRRCGPYRLFTRAVAVRTDGVPGTSAIDNVGCRIALLQYSEGVADPEPIDIGKPSVIERAPSSPLRNLRWRRWGGVKAIAKGRTREAGESKRVRIVAFDGGYCAAIDAIAYRRVRVTIGSGASRYAYTARFRAGCRE